MFEIEAMTTEELYKYKEALYVQLMVESSCINYDRLLETINAISLELKKRRRRG